MAGRPGFKTQLKDSWMSRLNALRQAGLPADARAVLSRSTTEDYSPFFGTEQSDAITASGMLATVLDLMLHPALLAGDNPVVDKLREDFDEEEFMAYVPVDAPDAEPLPLMELDEEDFEEDGETVRADLFTGRIDRAMVAEMDFDDLWEHPAMTVIDTRNGSYDHKRKYLDITAEISLTVGQVLQLTEIDLLGWTVSVQTGLGMTTVE